MFADRFPEVDTERLLKICLIHDLGEAISGDISAVEQPPDGKADQEREDLLTLTESLPDAARQEIVELWEEYEAASTPEARLAKGLDKLETILQHIQGENPADFDYHFNLTYGTTYTKASPLLTEVRTVLDEATQEEALKQTGRRNGGAEASSESDR